MAAAAAARRGRRSGDVGLLAMAAASRL